MKIENNLQKSMQGTEGSAKKEICNTIDIRIKERSKINNPHFLISRVRREN